MSELRKDIISGRWVIIAQERSKRPDDFRPYFSEKEQSTPAFCPFCSGNESKTPPEIFSLRREGTKKDKPGWWVRVVANKFPALKRGTQPVAHEEGIFKWMDGVGVHEVVIETPEHDRELPDLPLYHFIGILDTYRERVRSIEKEPQYRYVHVFKNRGRDAGASLSHSHSQIIATPIIPKKLGEELWSSARLRRAFKECIFCRVIRDETKTKDRLILKNDHFCVIAPYAPRFPFEMRVYPLHHSAWFTELSRRECRSLAKALQEILLRLRDLLADPPYNFYIHQAPNPHLSHPSWPELAEIYHWHIEIIPVLTRVAGFEWGTGFYINPMAPEAAAVFMRSRS